MFSFMLQVTCSFYHLYILHWYSFRGYQAIQGTVNYEYKPKCRNGSPKAGERVSSWRFTGDLQWQEWSAYKPSEVSCHELGYIRVNGVNM